MLSYGDHLTHRRFMVSTGIGMDAMVCQDILHSKTKRGLSKVGLGKLSYMLVGAKRILFTRPVKGYLVLDGAQKVEFNHIYFVAVHNHPYEGGGFRFAPGADPGDGRLNVCVIHSASRLRVLKLLISALVCMSKKKKNRTDVIPVRKWRSIWISLWQSMRTERIVCVSRISMCGVYRRSSV